MGSLFKLLRRYSLYLYIFYVIYTPSIAESALLNKYTFLVALIPLIAIPYIIKRDKSVLKILLNRYVILLMSFVLISSFWLMTVQILNNISIESFADYRFIQNNIINILIIHCAFIIDKLKKRGFSKDQALEVLFKLAALQGIYSLLSLMLPSLRDVSIMLYNATGGTNEFVIAARVFGISSDFTYGTPIYHGLLGALAVFMAIKRSKIKYLYYALPIFMVCFLNGRTGIFIFLLTTSIFILREYLSVRHLKRLIGSFVALVLVLLTMLAFTAQVSPSTYVFIQSFISDTTNLTEGNTTGNYDILLSEIRKVPEGMGLLFGTGIRVYEQDATGPLGFRTDIGYTNDLFLGGLVFIVILYGGIIIYLLSDTKNRDSRFLFTIILVVLALANIKGEILHSSIFMFLVIYLKLLDKNYRENNT